MQEASENDEVMRSVVLHCSGCGAPPEKITLLPLCERCNSFVECPQPLLVESLVIQPQNQHRRVIIPRGTLLPAHYGGTISTSTDNQTSLEVRFFAGDMERGGELRSLGIFFVSDIRPAPGGQPEIELFFALDAEGKLEVSVSERGSTRRTYWENITLRVFTPYPDQANLSGYRASAEGDEPSGTGHFRVRRVVAAPVDADTLHKMGRKFGSDGVYNKAIELFQKAHRLLPDWPYPPYDLAYTYMLQGNFEKALEFFELTDRLAPRGFYTSKTALDTLRKEAEGILPEGTYFSYLQLEWTLDRDEKLLIASALTRKAPAFARGWYELGMLMKDPGEKMLYLERALECDPDVHTRGMVTVNRALSLNTMGRIEEAKELLNGLLADDNTPEDVIHFARFSLSTLNRLD